MRKLVQISFLFFLFLVVFINSCFSQWTKVYTHGGYPLYDFAFINDSTGVMGSYQSMTPASKALVMIRTNDFGSNWNATNLYTQGGAPSLGRIGGDTITMLSNDSWYPGTFMISPDGGQTYQTSYAVNTSAFKYHYKHLNYGIYSANAGFFLFRRYSNTISSVGTFTTSGIRDLWMNSFRDFFVISGNKLYTTNDTGATWNIAATPTVTMNKIAFSSYSIGYIACTNGSVMKTMDAGATWTVLNTGFTQNLNGLSFKNDTFGYVVGDNGTVLKTMNGGNTWVKEPFPGTPNLYAVTLLKKKAYILVNNSLYRKDIDTCSSFPPTPTLTASTYTSCYSSAGNPTIALTGTPIGGNYSGPNVIGNIFYAPTATTALSSNSVEVYYTVTNSSGCASATSATIQITNPLAGIVNLTVSSQTVCLGGSISLFGSPSGGTYSGSNVTGPLFTAPTSTTSPGYPDYFATYTYIDSQGCQSGASYLLHVFNCVGIEELNLNKSEVSIYPNPASEEVNIKGLTSAEYDLYNSLGQKINSIKLSAENNFQTKLIGLNSGLYYLKNEKGTFKLVFLTE